MDENKVCILCCAEVSSHPIVDGIHVFCCMGCHAVYQILSVKNQLEGFQDHPIFLQALQSGLISNPALLEHIQRQRVEVMDGERAKVHLEVGDMWCPSCAEIIRLMLLKERGVINCVVDYATDLTSVEFSPRHISKETIIEIIKNLGYRPQPLDSAERKAVSYDLYLRFGIAAFCSLNIMMLAYPLYATYFDYDGEEYGLLFAWLSFFVALPVVLYSAWPIWRRFFTSLKVGFYGMETLVAIGVGAAFGVSLHELLAQGTKVYFDSMSVVIVFVLLGKIIETKAKFSAKQSLLRLSRAIPRRGRKGFADGSSQFVLVKEIDKGDTLLVYSGEKITLDGVVIEGEGACDESLMTGEAVPVVKKTGYGVLGGTILVQGYLAYRVSTCQEETALSKIIEMVEQDIGNKTVYVRAADSIVRWFVPLVICIAAATAMGCLLINPHDTETAFLRALAVLLISCPCAIGIAAPAAESYLLNGLAALGVIVRNRGCLPSVGKEDAIVFDKTGTVTEGRFTVHSGFESLSEEDKVALYSLASRSTHPVSCGIALAFSDTTQLPVVKMEEMAGFGLRGEVAGSRYSLGSKRFLEHQGIEQLFIEPHDNIMTCVYFTKDGECLAQILLGDKVRPEVQELIASLKPSKTILLSGDAEASVAAVAKFCGFDSWKSGCTPLEKREFIDNFRKNGQIVCMLGDGINDAPALTAAHVGISVVSASDMSIQVSDLLLTTDRLNVLGKARQLAIKGHYIINQNLFWAFFYNVIGIFLAIFGVLTPVFAAFAMSISSLTVLFNAKRIK